MSTRSTPDGASRVARPYGAGRNDVMPFTAEELMLFKASSFLLPAPLCAPLSSVHANT